jgi:2-dehydropantoate 2-reductase
MRVAILGAGSLGTIIGALITKGVDQNTEVVLIDVNKAHVEALNTSGATITGHLETNIPVKAIVPDNMEGIYDLVVLLTKQTFNDQALKPLLNHLDENSTVCTLQNGIPEEFVASYVGKERTVGGAVGFGATWVSPGVSMLTSSYETVQRFAFDIGEINGEVTERIKKVQQVLSHVGNTEIMTNLMDVRWTKVLMNATFSGMSAALGCTFGEVLDNEKAMHALAYVADEVIKTANKNGNKIVFMQGKEMSDLEILKGQSPKDKMDFYHEVWGRHRALKASMLQDLEKGIPCEIDFINGYVAQKGREFGIETPYNDKIVELVKEAEAKKIVPSFDENIKRFH